ncbi:MAG: ABC-type Na+ efflux pump permease component-like protein [Bacteroidetes bacterium]|jgi:ABC-2 type transport system permease protein|nr:ABC-type Na+ efflux pump permease component-like protein [Bacteroidota bacterium]
MNKILLIIKREYLSRVRKKSFILMTILGPILMAGILVVPIWLSLQKSEKQKIEVIDESFQFSYISSKDGQRKGLIPENESVHFDYPEIKIEDARAGFYDTDYDAILYVPSNLLNSGQLGINLFYKKQLSNNVQEHIQSNMSKMIYEVMLAQNKVNMNVIKDAKDKSTFTLRTIQLDETGKDKETNTAVNVGIGFACAIAIYFLIFFYGAQVMRGVMEEKTSRIVEVILSSVKPFQLMMGKIIGVAMVGLTQFILWVILTTSIYSIAAATVLKGMDIKQVQQKEEVIRIGQNLDVNHMGKIEHNPVVDLWSKFDNVDMTEILICFVLYFLAGYLLYSALFAAIGSAVDNEAETNQFMLPVTIPLVFSFMIAQFVTQDPQGSLAFWFSMIPLTSPVVMMVRLPFGVPMWELALSISLLIGGFVATTWLAGRIYRTGILMYGKKVSWKELGKWLFYKG